MPATGSPRGAARPGRMLVVGVFATSIIALALIGTGAAWYTQTGIFSETSQAHSRAHDIEPSGRSFSVRTGVPADARRKVWWLMELAGIPESCGDAKVWSVAETTNGPPFRATRFVVYCRRGGFYVIEDDPQTREQSSIGPVSSIDTVESMIDEGGTFDWAQRRPTGFRIR